MIIRLDGVAVDAKPDQTLEELIVQAGLCGQSLVEKPLAAQICGEIFHLRYNPVRTGEHGKSEFRTTVQDANGAISLLRYQDTLGRRVYERSLLYVLMLAVRSLFPSARVLVQYTLGPGLYLKIEKSTALTTRDVARLKEECCRIVEADLPLQRERLDIHDAIAAFTEDNQIDKVRLLQYRSFSYFDVYRQSGYLDYFYGEMVPSTGYLQVFDLAYQFPGMVMLLPDRKEPDQVAAYAHSPRLASVFAQSDHWGRLMQCGNVADLNDLTKSGGIRELVRINEALHEKSYSQLADKIVARNARAVLIAGPSSSGKTTSANRLYTHLRVHGKNPVMISLDDYYIDRHLVPVLEDGTQDLEHIETLDIARFRSDLERLIAGEQVEMPAFDFKAGRRKEKGKLLQVGADEPLLIEGIHGLNPLLVSDAIPAGSVYRVYVSALTTLNLDDHNRIRTTDIRLLRRMVRDYESRGASPERTLSMWESVRRGEERWIFPYQEEADTFFNTALVYEIAVLKKHIFPILREVEKNSCYYAQVHDLMKFLRYFADAHVEDEIPPTSILREFIGGSAFFRD